MYFRFKLSSELQGTKILDTAPLGWNNILFELDRDRETHGVMFHATSLNLEFTCGAGKEFIETEYKANGIDAEVSFIVEIVCNCDIVEVGGSYSSDYSDDYETGGVGADCDYEELFTGRLDFSEYEINKDYVSIAVEQAGIHKTVETRMDTKIDLTKLETLDGTALTAFDYGPYDLTLHSKKIIFKDEFSVDGSPFTFNDANLHTTPVRIEIGDISETSEPVSYAYGEYFLYNNEDHERTFNVTGRLKFTSQQTSTFINDGTHLYSKGYEYRIWVYDESRSSVVNNYLLNSESAVLTSDALESDFAFSQEISVPAGHYVALVYINTYELSIDPGGVVSRTANYDYDETVSYVKVVEGSVTNSSTCKAFAVFEAGARIAQAITNQTDAFRSEIFGRKNAQPYAESENGCLSFMAITNGALIRQFPISDTTDSEGNKVLGRPVRISLNEFFNGLNPIGNLGMGIEREGSIYRIRIDKKEYFYQDEVLFQLSNVPDLKISAATDYYYNKIDIGYETWENEEVNGLDEFNTKRQYDAGIKNIKNELKLESGFIAGGYAIEFTRRKEYQGSWSEDWKYDNNNFIICLNRSVDGSGNPSQLNVAEKNENFSTVNNLISPETSYNIRISPARNLLRWSNVINPGLKKYSGRELKFTYGEGNYALETAQYGSCAGNWNNQLLSEGKDIQHDSVDNTDNTPIWEPEYIEFKYPLTFAQFTKLRDNPYKCIEVSRGEDNYIKGYLLEARFAPLGGLTEFKLLKAWSLE